MCSIIGSHDLKELAMLAEVNAYRGSRSHSICAIKDGVVQYINRGFGKLNVDDYIDNLPTDAYYIGHQQAPTTGEPSIDTIHPAQLNGCLLWHNGIIKDYQIKEWQDKFKDYDTTWDTEWLIRLVCNRKPELLSDVDGSFACAFYDFQEQTIMCFRNDLCPIWFRGSTISSTKWDQALNIPDDHSMHLIPSGQICYLTNDKEWYRMNDDTPFTTKQKYYWSQPV